MASPATQRLYRPAAETLKEVFANFLPDQITHGHVVQMMDAFAHMYRRANQLHTVLNMTLQSALDCGKVDSNLCVSVKRFATESRDWLLSREEYGAIHAQAQDWMQCIMDICYQTGQRIGDVPEIEEDHILDRGIIFQQQKTRILLSGSQRDTGHAQNRGLQMRCDTVTSSPPEKDPTTPPIPAARR